MYKFMLFVIPENEIDYILDEFKYEITFSNLEKKLESYCKLSIK